MGGSMAIATAFYAGLAVLIVGSTTAARREVGDKEPILKFVAAPLPPQPPPLPDPVAPQPAAKTPPKGNRKELKAPEKLPDEKPKESDTPLAEAAPSGPVEAFL